MITPQQFDKIINLELALLDAVRDVHTAAPEDKLTAAFGFSSAERALYEYLESLTEKQ